MISWKKEETNKQTKKINKNNAVMPLGGDSWELWHILNLIK